jgi:mandelate racemase
MSFASPLRLKSIRARPVLVPFKRPPRSASGAMPACPLVLIDLETDGGVTGSAYVFGFLGWTLKPIAGCVEGLFSLIQGDPLAPLDLEAKLRSSIKLLDSPGLVGLALNGIDMALWDALAKAQGLPLVRLLGGTPRPIPAYNSCGLWIQAVDTLADEAEQLVAEGEFNAVKLRLGRPDAAQDLAALRAVKQRLGERIQIMIDVNQRLSIAQAIERGRMLDAEGGVSWFEEPVRHDDYRGCARVRDEIDTPVSIGENLTSSEAMQEALAQNALDYVMPDVQRIGGVSGWLRAAALARAHGIEMSSHLFPEISAQLLAVTPTCHWLEYVDWAAPILAEPAQLAHGHVLISERPGSGVAWNEEAVTRYAVS